MRTDIVAVRVPSIPFPLSESGDAHWSVDGASVATIASPRTDYFLDPGYTAVADEYTRLNADTLLGDLPEGDFQFTAEVVVQFGTDFDAGVLLLWRDDRHWAKLCFERSREHEPLIVSVVTREYSDDANAFAIAGNRAWLRIVRMGSIVAFHASTDGTSWRMVRVFTFGVDAPFARVGFLAQSPNGEGCPVRFDNVRFSTALPDDIRAGA